MIRKLIAGMALLCAVLVLAGFGGSGVDFGKLGARNKWAGSVACGGGAPTGHMDFSVCSNVAITAAVMP